MKNIYKITGPRKMQKTLRAVESASRALNEAVFSLEDYGEAEGENYIGMGRNGKKCVIFSMGMGDELLWGAIDFPELVFDYFDHKGDEWTETDESWLTALKKAVRLFETRKLASKPPQPKP